MARPGRRPGEQTKMETKLATWRVFRGMTQAEVAEATGIPLSTYWKLERDLLKNPGVRHLANCALVLGCELEELIEDEWRDWFRPLVEWPTRPREPEKLWRAAYWDEPG
jgi:transcriptional regulator with XRE-family HTH domain